MNKIIDQKIILLFATLVTGISTYGQTGIRFEKTLSWKQILDKAKTENRYIFVDCYATWCAPCKMMDMDVYSQQKVGEAYNSAFINVKVQIDKTKTDDAQTQSWYSSAALLEYTYHIEALPMFLFFDPEGRMVLQRSGAMEPVAFIQLGRDARNPDILSYNARKFQPGKLDTAEERGLINVYATSDRELAGRIAADYLSRIPKDQLSKEVNGRMMVQFSENPQVLAIAVNYIRECLNHPVIQQNLAFIYALKKQPQIETVVTGHFEKLGQQEFADTANLKLATNFLFYPGVKRAAIKYTRELSYQNIGVVANLSFISRLDNEPEVQSIAGKYIVQLTQREIYTKPSLNFIAAFTRSTGSVGMDIFYNHAKRANAVIGSNEFARNQVIFGLLKKEFEPVFTQSKQSGQEPDWQTLSGNIKKNYGSYYAEVTVDYARMNWFLYLCRDKKLSQHFPKYLNAAITKMQRLRNDTVASSIGDNFNLNNIAYAAFGHIEDLGQLKVVTNWMQEVTRRNPDNIGDFDTYACLLYRIGKADSALTLEQKTLQMAIAHDDKFMISHATITIEKMKKGELFWEEKEYQQ